MCKVDTNVYNMCTFEPNANGMRISFDLPIHEEHREYLSEAQVREIHRDILGAFSSRIAESLKRRMGACMEKLFAHIGSAYVLEDSNMQVFYTAKNNRLEAFNRPSFEVMAETVRNLELSRWNDVLENRAAIDQILKALLNDTEQNHEDAGGFKYSQLVSLLCELHVMPM